VTKELNSLIFTEFVNWSWVLQCMIERTHTILTLYWPADKWKESLWLRKSYWYSAKCNDSFFDNSATEIIFILFFRHMFCYVSILIGFWQQYCLGLHFIYVQYICRQKQMERFWIIYIAFNLSLPWDKSILKYTSVNNMCSARCAKLNSSRG
jgi:hypothetical protein